MPFRQQPAGVSCTLSRVGEAAGAGVGGPVLPEWDSPIPPRARKARGWRWLLLATVFFGVLTFIAMCSDSRAWDAVKRDSVRTPAVVRAIHQEDNFLTPSRVEVDLGSQPARALTVRTSDDELYRVGAHVEVWFDARHPQRAGFVGDSTGPTWALGAMNIGAFGAAISGVGTAIALLAAALRSVRTRPAGAPVPLPAERAADIRAAIGDVLAVLPEAVDRPGEQSRPIRLVRAAESSEREAWLMACAGAFVTLVALAAHVASGTGRFGVDAFLIHVCAPGLLSAGIQIVRSRRARVAAVEQPWAYVGVRQLPAVRRIGPVFLLVEDPTHAVVVRQTRDTQLRATAGTEPALLDGGAWVTRAGRSVWIAQTISVPTGARIVRGWQQHAAINISAHSRARTSTARI